MPTKKEARAISSQLRASRSFRETAKFFGEFSRAGSKQLEIAERGEKRARTALQKDLKAKFKKKAKK